MPRGPCSEADLLHGSVAFSFLNPEIRKAANNNNNNNAAAEHLASARLLGMKARCTFRVFVPEPLKQSLGSSPSQE